jgi:integrase
MTRLRLNTEFCPATADGWTLTNSLGQPRFWPTVWVDGLQASLKHSTRGKKLYAIEKLYQSAVHQLGADQLDAVLSAADTDVLESILGGFLATLRNESAVDAVDRDEVWHAALTFVEDILTRLRPLSGEAAVQLSANLLRLQRLYRQIAPTPPRPPAPIRALPAGVIEELYEIFRPDSLRNPFRTRRSRWRNFLLFILLLHLGLRRGEALILRADAVKDDFDPTIGNTRYWIDIQETPYEDDPRHSAPSIKTIASRRQLPVSAEVLNLIDIYVQNHRGRCPHGFMFNSQKERPLAPQTVAKIFKTATSALSERAHKLLSDQGNDSVSPHYLRHTAAVFRLSKYVSAGMELDMAIEKLRVFFGWSPGSQMPRHYARAYFETKLGEVWEEKFDDYVDAIRREFPMEMPA